jgi:ectoine hydroxylase-related dioxygenase (phytanoyl-CoA dioxygenase family)
MKAIVPENTYGIVERMVCEDYPCVIIEQLSRLGYAIVDVGMSANEVATIKSEFDLVRDNYVQKYGLDYLQSIDEHNTVRLPLSQSEHFRRLATNQRLHSIISALIKGTYILNQQNGIVNPPNDRYNQGAWHRDLPYQHFTSSSPLALNALYCVDDFTRSNGATYVLPGSHLHSGFPSIEYTRRHAIQVEAPAGSFVLMDCMIFHSGGFNSTSCSRRAINHVFSIPYLKQQIGMQTIAATSALTEFESKLFGVEASEPNSIEQYLSRRKPL